MALQRDTHALAAFAPLPRVDPPEAPSTGYDDVKTIVAARLMAASIPHIQVDWALYGPKLAQVAIEYGADDIDEGTDDEDGDGIPNYVDPDSVIDAIDSDGDGLTDGEENVLGSDPLSPDSDGDGVGRAGGRGKTRGRKVPETRDAGRRVLPSLIALNGVQEMFLLL